MTLETSWTVVREIGHLVQLSTSQQSITVSCGKVNETFKTLPLIKMGPSLYRKFICAEGCRACCRSFGPLSLDYIPDEPEWLRLDPHIRSMFSRKFLLIDGRRKDFYSLEKPHSSCLLESETGCSIWPNHPLACHASARIAIAKYLDTTQVLKKRGFSRTWRWKEVAHCEYPEELEWDLEEFKRDDHIFDRYQVWADYFDIPTIIPQIRQTLRHSYDNKSVLLVEYTPKGQV